MKPRTDLPNSYLMVSSFVNLSFMHRAQHKEATPWYSNVLNRSTDSKNECMLITEWIQGFFLLGKNNTVGLYKLNRCLFPLNRCASLVPISELRAFLSRHVHSLPPVG